MNEGVKYQIINPETRSKVKRELMENLTEGWININFTRFKY